MYNIVLEWKEFNVNMNMVQAWMEENMNESFKGISADVNIRLYFSEQPSEEMQTQINAYWDGLTEESVEATSYKSAEQERLESEAANAAAKTSAKAKLEALGLNEAEVKAILGL